MGDAGNTGDVAGALEDHGQAVVLLERLQERLGDQWLPVYDEHLRVARELRTAAASFTK